MSNKISQLSDPLPPPRGFTLLEILIALFIFTILSMILVGALRSVIDVHAGTEKNADRLRRLQIALLVTDRDVEQTVNRPVLNASAKEVAAFVGTPNGFTFTHSGFANPTGMLVRSNLQRTAYAFKDKSWWRLSWPVLDFAPETQSHERRLLTDVASAHCQYLDKDGRWRDNWPVTGENQPLPRAVKISLLLTKGGNLTQVYVIEAKPSQNIPVTPPGSNPAKSATETKEKAAPSESDRS